MTFSERMLVVGLALLWVCIGGALILLTPAAGTEVAGPDSTHVAPFVNLERFDAYTLPPGTILAGPAGSDTLRGPAVLLIPKPRAVRGGGAS